MIAYYAGYNICGSCYDTFQYNTNVNQLMQKKYNSNAIAFCIINPCRLRQMADIFQIIYLSVFLFNENIWISNIIWFFS